MTLRNRAGVTLGLIPFIILIITMIGMASFYFAQFLGGNKQLANATDSGALGAARQMLTIGLTKDEIATLPPEFQALAVDNTGAPVSIDPTTGQPNLQNAIFNVYAFNRAAGYTLMVALNAAEDGSQAGINNANALITALNNFGTALNKDIQNSPQFAATFANIAAANNTNMLGQGGQSLVSLGDNDQMQFASVPGQGTGKANVYFNSNVYANDSTLQNWIQQITVSSGVMSQASSSYSQKDPTAQSGQPFVYGYQAIDLNKITQITNSPNFVSPIYTCAVNPSQIPHMIDSNRFQNTSVSNQCYAPCNSLSATGQASDLRTNLACTALACAMLGAYNNEYPITMPYGWVRLKNNPDAIAANQGQKPTVGPVPYWVDGFDNIFNNELFNGPGGLGGVWFTNNGVFCTEAYNNPTNPYDVGPPGYSGKGELTAWINYNTSGQNQNLNPTTILGYASPTANLRYSANYQQVATVAQMNGVTSVVNYCESTMYNSNTPDYCTGTNMTTWNGNYHGGDTTGTLGPPDTGTQPVGGLTNLEYLKGEVIGQFWDALAVGPTTQAFANYSYTLVVPQSPSGSKLYDRSNATSYATPSNTATVAFGTVGTPAQLINQLNQNAASCANMSDDSQWSNISTPLGKLLQRCKQILPSVTQQDIIALLGTYPINLNQYQYIYLPTGGNKLTISNTPPPFLQQLPEYAKPGSILPDGTTVLTCSGSVWDESGSWQRINGGPPVMVQGGLIGNVINAEADEAGNTIGDGDAHWSPFLDFNGNLATYDAVNWTSNSGRNNFLGELSFGNYVNGTNGTAGTFSQPN